MHDPVRFRSELVRYTLELLASFILTLREIFSSDELIWTESVNTWLWNSLRPPGLFGALRHAAPVLPNYN